jgi:hypothetical protein
MQIVLAMAAFLSMAQDKPAELKDNPLFKYWTDCKAGSWVKMTMEIDQGGQKVETEQIQKLLEVAEDKVVLEVSGKMKMAAGEFPLPARKQDVKAKEPGDKVKIEKEGDEEIEVAGKKLKCHWYELTIEVGPKPMKMKAWMAKEIPGGLAKSEMSPEGQKMMVMIAVEWEKK